MRKAAAKTVSLLKFKEKKDVAFSQNTISDILNKLLTIAISDPDMEVRKIMLNSLNHNFNVYLKKRSNLQKLILSLNDSSEEVQEKTVIILKRLIPSNPTEIIPALKKVLYKLIKVINLKAVNNHKGIRKNLKILRCYIEHAPFLLKNHKDLLFRFLLDIIKNRDSTPEITAEIFSTLNSLISISSKETVIYFDEMFSLLLESAQDLAFMNKRLRAVQCLSNVVHTSGLVVYINYKYSDLNELLFLLFQVEPNTKVRTQLMKLMGHLGAIDCFSLLRLKSGENDKLSNLSKKGLLRVIEKSHKSKFYFESKSKLP